MILALLGLACAGSGGGEQVTPPATPPAEAAAEAPAEVPAEDPAEVPAAASAALAQAEALLDAGDLPGALAAFQAAEQQDPTGAAAALGAARALALLRQDGRICPFDATEPAILDAIERALRREPALAAAVRAEPAFAPLRATIRYRLLDGAAMDSDAALEALLTGIELYGPPQGAFGAMARVELRANGDLRSWSRARDTDGVPGPWTASDGAWSVQGGRVHLEALGAAWVLSASPAGTLEDSDGPQWFDHPAECAA